MNYMPWRKKKEKKKGIWLDLTHVILIVYDNKVLQLCTE